jgi:hypothetical protein
MPPWWKVEVEPRRSEIPGVWSATNDEPSNSFRTESVT